ncbi:hypothetical protein AN401_11590 [Zobellella denitrificans]|uniref:Uncharacterized protein n=1 Tax=Zobellella denitrificans TaxID=347534 RepID=A0A291HQD4_9GAMM|nr:hypothetical protein [Zobellella denitrificans]ATG74342.1 hypothetical protein AN401_11145 [Zobellella denitrificans]ATG74415.1 hypothetical protein AN401_11590 [Zobellella denitrificans]
MSKVTLTVEINEANGALSGTCQVAGGNQKTLAWALAQGLAKNLPELMAIILNDINEKQQEHSNATH